MSIEQTACLLFIAAIVSMGCRRLRLPYTVGLTVAGFGLALLPSVPDLQMTKDLLFSALLPPLIFEAALQIHWPALRRDFFLVGFLATVGVFVSVAVLFGSLRWGLGWTPPLCLVIAVLLSATDPVSVLATFKDSGLGGRLRLLVEAESLFNDGTVAVLFALALTVIGGTPATGWSFVASFFLTVLGGILVGGLVGWLSLLLAGGTEDPLVEVTFTSVAAYGSFLAAEHVHVSGVLATLVAGIVMGSAGALAKFSDRGREAVNLFWDYAAFAANSLVFLLIGVRLAHRAFAPVWIAVAAVILLSLVARALSVYLLCGLFTRSRYKVELRSQHVLFWGGLRGALALALALGLPPELAWRETVINIVFGVVAFSVVVQGLTFSPLLRKLKLLPAAQPSS